MKLFIIRVLNVIFGLFLYALGIVTTIRAGIGYAPWDVFHVGLSYKTGLSIGTISILVGLILVVFVLAMGEKIGLGTILNMILIGAFVDLILLITVIPVSNGIVTGLLMLIAGLFLISLGTYFYIRAAFGAGPRDSLMVTLARKTKLPIGLCRGIIEGAVTIAGWFLGGMVGVGTLISAIGIGFCVQLVFRVFRFDATAIEHETLGGTYTFLTGKKDLSL